MSLPKVSILMNAFNAERYLKLALDSIYAQTYPNWEVIFIDNCSTDATKSIVQRYDERLKYHTTPQNIPLGEAREFGLQFCKGDYVAFLDTDDLWMPTKLETQVHLHEESPDVIMSYTGGCNIDEEGRVLSQFTPKVDGDLFENLLYRYDINMQTVLIKNTIDFEFDKNKLFSEDFDTFMKIASSYEVKAISDELVSYRIHINSLTSKTKARWSIEFRETLNDILSDTPALRDKYPEGFKKAFAKADYYEARYLVEEQSESISAFKILIRNSSLDFRYLVLAFAALLPVNLWNRIHGIP